MRTPVARERDPAAASERRQRERPPGLHALLALQRSAGNEEGYHGAPYVASGLGDNPPR